ncbi:MAG: sugar transferase [Sulfurospirillaceae bacterium]|nr:sugar transferase [Sulfurospirillaceae bacterium]
MKKHISAIILFSLDAVFLNCIYYVAWWFRSLAELFGMPPFLGSSHDDFSLVLMLILLILWYEKIYTYRFDFWEETRLILKALFLSFVIVLAFLMLNRIEMSYSRSFIILYFALLALCFPVFKRVSKKIIYHLPYFRKKVKIVGNAGQKKLLVREFEHNWYLGLHYCEDRYEAIFIATKNMPIHTLNEHLNQFAKETKDIYILPYAEKANFSKANMIEYFNIRTSVIHLENELLKIYNIVLKEFCEKFVILLASPFLMVAHIIISFLIMRDSKGPIVFPQTRLGKNGHHFTCYKYRTMYPDSHRLLEEYLQSNPEEKTYFNLYHKYQNDPRITSIGRLLRKTSLDELPQFLNVFKGDMSLVGPRPYMIDENAKLADDAKTILLVKPGITGLWQVSGRNNLTFNKRKELDMWYIQNWSLWMDFIILMKTIKVVLSKKGAQ